MYRSFVDTIVEKLSGKIAPWYKNLRGWRTDRKIVVIESDDWGSIRMPSRQVYDKCLHAGYHVDKIAYEKYDSLASEDDLEMLFDLLSSFKDKNGNHPVITANVLTANPDFDKIKNSGFTEYHYESIKETFNRYPKHRSCFDLWMQGLNENVFYPQSHGREHLNVSMFMNALKACDEDAMFAFENRMPGIMQPDSLQGNMYVESLKYSSDEDKTQKLKIVLEGLKQFEELFGYISRSFIPPNYFWSPDFNEQVSRAGVKFYQGNRRMKEPHIYGEGNVIHSHILGKKNKYGQVYLIRNSMFEPSLGKSQKEKAVNQCLKQINASFTMKKPAIVCSHRLNYVGYLDQSNRDRTLQMLKTLLREILKKWPAVEFMTSDKLGTIIKKNDSTKNP